MFWQLLAVKRRSHLNVKNGNKSQMGQNDAFFTSMIG